MLTQKLFLSLSTALVLILSGCGGATQPAQYTEFAQCLTDQDIVMYGAFWCPHCVDQKALFGDAIENVSYVECDAKGKNPQPELCLAKGIESYPTWIRSDGERVTGTQTLEQLESFSTCKLPVEESVPAVEPTVPTE